MGSRVKLPKGIYRYHRSQQSAKDTLACIYSANTLDNTPGYIGCHSFYNLQVVVDCSQIFAFDERNHKYDIICVLVMITGRI